MMKSGYYLRLAAIIVSLATSIVCADAAQKSNSSDAQIKKTIIKESIEQYPGNCPCPYNTARNGSRCGGRSAYSRVGGYAPLCYDRDVTQNMIMEWKSAHVNK